MGHKIGELKNNSLYDRVKKLLVSYDWSDCTFSVCNKKFKAHKLILGISSPVFEAMFYGPLSTNNDIVITDIEPDIFQKLLDYIYTDKVNIASIEEAYELLYVSRKYLLDHLSEVCVKHVQSSLDIDNVITILNYPDYMQDKELLTSSLRLFCEHAVNLFQKNIKYISSFCLQKILSSNAMNISEKELIKFTFEWTSLYCEANNIVPEFHNRREVLIKNGLFKLLRFFTLFPYEVDEIFLSSYNLLLPQEYKNIIDNLKQSKILTSNNVGETLSPFTVPRNRLKLHWYLCHRGQIRSAMPAVVDSNHNFIHCRLKFNKSIFLNYLNIPTRMTPVLNYCNNTPKEYNERILISLLSESENKCIAQCKYNEKVDYDSYIDIEFKEPWFMKKDNWYKICFNFPNNNDLNSHAYGVQYREMKCTSSNLYVEFEDIFSCDNYGSFLRGFKFCL